MLAIGSPRTGADPLSVAVGTALRQSVSTSRCARSKHGRVGDQLHSRVGDQLHSRVGDWLGDRLRHKRHFY